MALGMAQRAVASGNRLFEILDREPRIDEPAGCARRCRRAPARSSFKRVDLALRRRRAAGADRDRPRGRGRPHGGAGRPDRLGQDQPGGADRAPLRPERGQRSRSTAPTCARSTSPRCAARSPSSPTTASCSRASVAENIAYARPEATPRADRAGRAARPGARVHPRAPRRLRDRGRRARADALGRPAPAGRDRPGADRRAPDPDPRRRDLVGRRDHRGGDQARAARGDGGPDHLRRRPPALDDLARRRDRGHGRRPDRRPGHATRSCSSAARCTREIAEFGCEDVLFLQHDLEEREEVARL